MNLVDYLKQDFPNPTKPTSDDSINASSLEGIAYRTQIEGMICKSPEAAQAFLKQFDEDRGCDPSDFLDYFPHVSPSVSRVRGCNLD